MASAFIHNNCLCISGGRDRKTAVACDFFVPLPPRHRTLKEFAAQYIVDHDIPFSTDLPTEVMEFLTGLHRVEPPPPAWGPAAVHAFGALQ